MRCANEDKNGNCILWNCVGCLSEKMGGKKEECDGFVKPLEETIKQLIVDRIADMKNGTIAEEDLPEILAKEIAWAVENANPED
jgi:hypothetical protein